MNKKLLYDLYKLEQLPLTKNQLFDEFSILTYKYYPKNLGKIKQIFKTTNQIQDWRVFINKTNSNNGREIEDFIFNYISNQSKIKIDYINGKGKDLIIDGKYIEVKSSQENKINTLLQTSFYQNDPNKFYLFVRNTKTNTLNIQLVSSQLLYYYTLGHDIINEIYTMNDSLILDEQIDLGLQNLDFKTFIKTSILTGESMNSRKSFYVAQNNIRVRFSIYFEPK